MNLKKAHPKEYSMVYKFQLDKYIGKFVSLINGRMSLTGILKKRVQSDGYMLSIQNYSGFYNFDIEDVIDLATENATIIVLKQENNEKSKQQGSKDIL